jgi:hypothetical protein
MYIYVKQQLVMFYEHLNVYIHIKDKQLLVALVKRLTSEFGIENSSVNEAQSHSTTPTFALIKPSTP